jgi:zinc transporter ZupT
VTDALPAIAGIFALAFALIHIFVGRLTFLDGVPRSRWLSFAGGVAVSYIFLHILPELSAHQQTFAHELGLSDRAAESWVYLVALAGLATFYGLERAAKISRRNSRKRRGEDRIESDVLWLHVGSFALYNLLIGYLLLHREETGLWPLVIYFIAMALHFTTNDFGMRQDQKEQYDRFGRWIIAGAVLFGWALGLFSTLPPIIIGFLFAFLAGGVVLNVMKEELPEERQSRFVPFAMGGALYGALLIFSG